MLPDVWSFAFNGYAAQLVGAGSRTFTEDEAELRRILRHTPMQGAFRMAFTREPYFFSPNADPSVCYPFLVRHAQTNEARGICALTVMPVYWRGLPTTAAYLHLLRVLPAFRGGIHLLRAGYAAMQAFKNLVCPQGICFTSIVEDNTVARRLLETGVKGLPRYTPLGGLDTLALATRKERLTGMLYPASAADIPELAAFYAKQYGQRDLAPCLQENWFRLLGTPARPELRIDDFLLYRQGGAIAGSIALWDQRATRQTVVMGYAALPALARPLYNCWAKFKRMPPLPAQGHMVKALYCAFAAFAPEAADAVPDCLRDALRLARERGCDTVLLGNPQGVGVPKAEFEGLCYKSALYSVHHPDERAPAPTSGGLYPEVALL